MSIKALRGMPWCAIINIIIYNYIYIQICLNTNTFIYKIGVLVVVVALIGNLFTLPVVAVVGLLTALRAAPTSR